MGAASGVACARPADPLPDATREILAQERRALDQWAQGNPLGYLDIDAPDVTYFDDIGAHSRVDGLEAMRAYLVSLQGRIPPHHYELIDPLVQQYGDVGILTLHFQARSLEDQPLARWKATSVYRRVDGGWRIVHAHWSLVKGGDSGRTSTQ
jgi:ketosteroid isomerase-like protein